ncbi:MAG: Crp/Fnr family transcriptional regulator [Shinella sp.]|nr:MAG: Crp/Fnr family transcriptional regulator [Shinella sp.]
MSNGDLSNDRQAVTFQYSKHGPKLSGAFLRSFPAGATIFEPDNDSSRILFIKSGWVISSKNLSNGTRIVTEFALGGDMLSSVSAALAQESVQAVSPVTGYEFVGQLSGKGPDVSSQLSLIIIIEMMKRQARMAERLANIGRRDALERTGHLLLELATRSGTSTRPGFDGFECPLKQSDIGDAVGLSTVHINRVLKDMRVNGLVSFRNGIVEFLNRKKLQELIEFDASYLAGHMG